MISVMPDGFHLRQINIQKFLEVNVKVHQSFQNHFNADLLLEFLRATLIPPPNLLIVEFIQWVLLTIDQVLSRSY